MKKKNPSSLILINQILNLIFQKGLILSNKKVLVAFSGGQDSFCLIVLMLQFVNQLNFSIGSIHCNHLWHLNNLLKFSHLLKASFILNIPFLCVITSEKIFTEKEARIWRYSTASRLSQFYAYELLLTGHTLTDQVETLLLNLFRSSSKDGGISLFMCHFIVNKFSKNIFLSNYEFKNSKVKTKN